jgi:hypothetical protein
MTQVTLTGKIIKSEFYSNQHRVTMMIPAVDQYSQPQSFRVNSDGAFGEVGSEHQVTCDLRGFVKTKKYTDKNTGQPKEFEECNVYFEVVSSKPVIKPVQSAAKAS